MDCGHFLTRHEGEGLPMGGAIRILNERHCDLLVQDKHCLYRRGTTNGLVAGTYHVTSKLLAKYVRGV